MAKSYSKSAFFIEIKMPDVDELLKRVQNAEKNIDEACIKAINSALPVVEKAMKDGAARHRKGAGKYGTDRVYNAIDKEKAKAVGNNIFGTVGIDIDKHPKAYHAVYQEFGDGHSPCFPDPFIRPAFDDNKRKINKIIKESLIKDGVPIE